MIKSLENLRGQVMLLTTVVLSGTFLVVSGMVGFLMVYKIRQSTDMTNSTKAILAADSGIEWELYRCFKCYSAEICDSDCPAPYSPPSYSGPQMANNSIATTTVIFNASGTAESIKSVGKSGNTARAFQMMLKGATSTLP